MAETSSDDPSLENRDQWGIDYNELEFLEVIGTGAFGRVYAGKWRGKDVALKSIVIQLGAASFSTITKEKKWREFVVWHRLKYPYIVNLFGVAVRSLSSHSGEWELTFVMQRCEISLFEYLNRYPNLSMDTRIKYAHEIALGMKHIHDNDILHRDLKCMNILLLDDMSKICDFGTSRIKDETTIDMTRDCVGSPSHMAPEIWSKEAASRESDVWSYAMCVYNIFTGTPPFDGKDMYQLYQYLIMKDKRPEWPRRRRGIPKWIKDVVSDCWVRSPKKRLTFDQICDRFAEHTTCLLAPPIFDENKEEYVVSDPTYSSRHDRYAASMVLSAVGDTIGFFNAQFEACDDGVSIHEKVEEKGGPLQLHIGDLELRLSSDALMSLAIARSCINIPANNDFEISQEGISPLIESIAVEYIRAFSDMDKRLPGGMTKIAVKRLGYRPNSQESAEQQRTAGCKWYDNPYNKKGGGCGGTSRACPIGLRYAGHKNREKLIALSVESARLTHNHTTGFFGGLTAAMFTAFAIERIPIYHWGYLLVNETQPHALRYLAKIGRDVESINVDGPAYFETWSKYLKERGLDYGIGPAKFPRKFGVKERDAWYRSMSFSGKGGASGNDSVIIAYDSLIGALQASKSNPAGMWEQVLLRGVLHGGDSDSTGTIIGAWYGALYGFYGVPDCHLKHVEKLDEFKTIGRQIADFYGDEEKYGINQD